MASSSGLEGAPAPRRLRIACDACGAAAWIGRRGAGGFDAWCEACQIAAVADTAPAACAQCAGPLALEAPRFPELWGELQHLDAVLAGWAGDAQPLMRLLPQRPEYLTDLTPPAAREGDSPGVQQRLAWVAQGDWSAVTLAVASDTTSPEDPRLHAAAAIAFERLGDLAAAESSWTAVLERGESPRAHLARGALRARRGAWALADADLRMAGDSREARWNRAAVMLHRAVEAAPGLPATGVIEQARREAGETSAHWSDPTLGRLLWTLLLKRIVGRTTAERAEALSPSRAGSDERVLRGAEALFEHDTFWDRAYQLAGYALAGLPRDAARLGAPLADRIAAALQAERAVMGEALRALAGALALARVQIAAGTPSRARALIAPALANEPLRRYRLPCIRCLAGSVGVEAFEEQAGG